MGHRLVFFDVFFDFAVDLVVEGVMAETAGAAKGDVVTAIGKTARRYHPDVIIVAAL